MATSGMMDRASPWRHLPVVLALIAPVLFCLGGTWLYAKHQQRAEAQAAVSIVRAQTEQMLSQASDLVARVATLTTVPCAQAQPILQRWASLNPYLRALSLVRDNYFYCSSSVGEFKLPIGEFHKWPSGVEPGRWLSTVAGTPLAPNRPAIVLGKPGDGGGAGVAVIDGHYVQDLLNAISKLYGYQMELKLGEGAAPIRSDSWGSPQGRGKLLYSDITQVGERSELTIRVIASLEAQVQDWQRLLMMYLPLAVLVGMGLAFGAYRLQLNRQSFKEQLRRAMRAGEFQVYYQPVYGQTLGGCAGVEALMRWERPGVGFVSPDTFIAAAEAQGMIIPLTLHLFALIERDMRTWTTPAGFLVGVNIAAEHLSSPEFTRDAEAFVANVAALKPLIVLEITERSLISDDGQARRNIDALRAQGVHVAIDDFGTGHCSLSYLQRFPVDHLKIDKGFVDAIGSVGEEAPVLDVIITLAHRLGLTAVAEGVETEVEFDYLTKRGVEFIQGYLFARPMPSAAFMRWYAGQQAQPEKAAPHSGVPGPR